jgi:ribosomal protein L11 methyltransferase
VIIAGTKARPRARRTESYVARLGAEAAAARRIADRLAESLDPAEAACAAFEQPGGCWQVEIHFRTRPNLAELRALVALAAGDDTAGRLSVRRIGPRDWVKQSLIGLRPVTAGRFVVHGAHDRDRVPGHCIGIEIEAGTAFGTGHHGTTRGCLLALDALARRERPRRILDLGTGSGVLAIAAAKVFRVPVLALDIDARAVETAQANAHFNGVGALVECLQADGFHARRIAERAPFDLVMCNILLRPLQRLAAPMARNLVPNAHVVLSGVLAEHANALISAYHSQALVLERAFVLDGWFTPLMAALSRSRR